MIRKTLGKVACVALCFALVLIPFTLTAFAQTGSSQSADYLTEGLNYQLSVEMAEEDGLYWYDMHQKLAGFGLSLEAFDYLRELNQSGELVQDQNVWLSSATSDVSSYDMPSCFFSVDQAFAINQNNVYFLTDMFGVETFFDTSNPDTDYFLATRYTLTTDYFMLDIGDAHFGVACFNFSAFDHLTVNVNRINTSTGEITSVSRQRALTDVPNGTNVIDISALFAEIGYQSGDLYQVSYSLFTNELGAPQLVELGFCYQVVPTAGFRDLQTTITPTDGNVFPIDYDNFNLGEWIVTSIEAVVNAPLFQIGNTRITIGTLLGVTLAVPIFVAFLKKFAGG